MSDRTISTEADYNDDQGYVHSSGDVISFARGQVYTKRFKILDDGLTTAENPIIITTHGTGEPPIFRTSTAITSWTSIGSNLWQWTNPNAKVVKVLLIDDTIICHRRTVTPTAEYDFEYNTSTHILTLYSPTDPSTRYTSIDFADTGMHCIKTKASNLLINAEFKGEKSYCMFYITDETATSRENITIYNATSDNCHNTVYVNSAAAGATLDNVNIYNSSAYNATGAGFRVSTQTLADNTTTNISIKNCLVVNCGEGESFAGVYFARASACYVSDCTVVNSKWGNYWADGSGFYADNGCHNIVFINNEARDCEGPIYQDNSGGANNKFINNTGINICSATIDTKNINAFIISDSESYDDTSTQISGNTIINPLSTATSVIRIGKLIATNTTLLLKNNTFKGFRYVFRYQDTSIVDYTKVTHYNNSYQDIDLADAAIAESDTEIRFHTINSVIPILY